MYNSIYLIKNIVTTLALISLVVIDSAITNIDWYWIALALFGSLTGSWLLEFFYPSKNFNSGLKRTLASTAASIFAGWGLTTYYQMSTPAYIGCLFAILGISILTTLRTVLVFWRNNAKDILVTIIRTKFQIQDTHTQKGKTVEKLDIKINPTNEEKE